MKSLPTYSKIRNKNMLKGNVMNLLFHKFQHPVFIILTILLTFLSFIGYSLIPNYNINLKNNKILLQNPESFCSSRKGWNAVADDRNYIYCMDETNTLVYTINTEQLSYKNAEIIDIIFDTNNHLYCHIAVYNENAYLTDSETVLEITPDGTVLREILHYDYTKTENPPKHQVLLTGLHFLENTLCYLYIEESGYSIVKINPDNPQQTKTSFYTQEGYGKIIQCHSTPDGSFLILKNNGEIGTIFLDGTYEMIYKSTYNTHKADGIFPYDVFINEDELYLLAGQEELTLYHWTENDWTPLFPIMKEIQTEKTADLYAFGLGAYENSLTLHLNDSLYNLKSDNTLQLHNIKLSLPFTIKACIQLDSLLLLIGILFLLLSVILVIGNLMKWRLTLLSKQLLSTIPLVIVMLLVVITCMLNGMINLNTEDILRETIAINEIAATQFNGDELSTITGFESVDNGQIKNLNDQLQTFMNGNQSGWSRNYNASIYVRTIGEKFVCIATSDGSNQFMINNFSTNTQIHQNFYEDSHTLAIDSGYGHNYKNLQLVLITPIYKHDGSYDAVMLLNASQNRLIQELISVGKEVLINIGIWVSLLILVITSVSAYNAKSLKKAKDVITQIACGDFSMRVSSYSKDEVGEICAGVNDMASRLEEYFNEKNRNEQFYYKFVPEKFRELLHKEKFTDLALGDAQSEDLSILFCDIRAFSMNSEMMTAKESFEFVNRIYGVAGPIIRKHNGFIDKYIGDAIMALFESADDAVHAGIELYQAIALNPNAEVAFGIPSVKIGIGIHSGMARIGIVGEEERMSGTVIANTVNLSSRIESLTKRYGAGMIISKDTLDRMENPDALSTRYLGMVQVAGVNEVSALYEVLDCLKDEQREKRNNNKLIFREAVRLFHTGSLEQSLELFLQLEQQDIDDKAAHLYVQYIQNKLLREDTEHNVFRFENK